MAMTRRSGTMFEIGTLVRRDDPESSTNGMMGIVVQRMPFQVLEVIENHADNPYCYQIHWNSEDRRERGPFWIFPNLLERV